MSNTTAAPGCTGPSRHCQLSGVYLAKVGLLFVAGGRPLADLLDHGRIGEGGRVAEVATFGHVTQQAAHDLAAARLGEVGRDDHRLGSSRRPDLLADVLADLLAELARRVVAAA